jgi:pyroglutamyl-peptidase
MAEQRSLLNLERYAHHQGHRWETSIDLPQLCANTQWTEISHDAGDYVCNDLYYRLLAYVNQHHLPIHCLFVHVPLLTQYNREPLVHDLAMMLSRLSQMRQERPQLKAA